MAKTPLPRSVHTPQEHEIRPEPGRLHERPPWLQHLPDAELLRRIVSYEEVLYWRSGLWDNLDHERCVEETLALYMVELGRRTSS